MILSLFIIWLGLGMLMATPSGAGGYGCYSSYGSYGGGYGYCCPPDSAYRDKNLSDLHAQGMEANLRQREIELEMEIERMKVIRKGTTSLEKLPFCIASAKEAIADFRVGRRQTSGFYCYNEVYASLEAMPTGPSPETKTPAPPSEPEPSASVPNEKIAFIRKALSDHKQKTLDPAFSSWSQEKRQAYASVWNQEEKLVVGDAKTHINLTP